MSILRPWFRFALLLGGLAFLTPGGTTALAQTKEEKKPEIRGISRLDKDQGPRYGKVHALIIGINYGGQRSAADREVVPPLKNAVNDARELHKLLVQHYGFGGPGGEAKLLLEEEATCEKIRDYLDAHLADPKNVSPNDCVLVFFAGHGTTLGGGLNTQDCGAILPYDVKIIDGKPTTNTVVWMQSHLFEGLARCKARHRLLILDCCYAGEIFKRPGLPAALDRGEWDKRGADILFKNEGFQAIASCREKQPALDGHGPADNSPFTGVLLDGLKTLPTEEGWEGRPFTTFELFKFMHPHLPGGQDPSCRCLLNDGEFRFFPHSDFSPYANRAFETKILQATVPGEHGNWWFEETPWLLPSVRRMILDEQDVSRDVVRSDLISISALRGYAERALEKLKERSNADPLRKVRAAHLENLLRPKKGKGFTEQLEKILKDLQEYEPKLDVTDLHLLAVVRHRLKDAKARDTYAKALDLYSRSQSDGTAKIDYPVLEAVCRADYAHYLTEVEFEHPAAIKEFDKVLSPGNRRRLRIPPPFKLFILCRQADVAQRMDHWAEANDRLNRAEEVAKSLQDDHPLTAYFFRRRAWARLEQWKIKEAQHDFEESNRRLEGNPSGDATIVKLHNRHGLAMALRFKGDAAGAGRAYRAILQDLSDAFRALRDGKFGTEDTGDIRSRLLERWVNTHERLADCNLFTAARGRDLKEANEDLRRALRSCPSLRPERRELERAKLLFKLAMVLALPKPTAEDQDLELAEAYCAQAQAILEKRDSLPLDVEFYPLLVPRLVALYRAGANKAGDLEDRRKALEALRQQIVELRDTLRENTHRDRLEMLMYVSKALVEEGIESDRFHVYEDTELLLGFCRKAMLSRTDETLAYLRQYFDAAVRARVAVGPKHIKDLLEIQKAATTGQFLIKSREPAPILALYTLEDRTYLFVDVPRGPSKHYLLPDDYTPDRLAEAALHGEKRLALPREVSKTLQALVGSAPPGDAGAKVQVQCWLDVGSAGTNPPGGPRVSGYAGVSASFPFSLPPGVDIAAVEVPEEKGRPVAQGKAGP